ncbi:bifunctional methylenetetrahydrofolate dehydrogenase/methenyltetrahydrofolate cyclohydrolase FolD [Anaeromusa acidaminophila]|uniref:bifunctional methylenetetrahydrofolate dehydrogenase/methenyltetrahydrofolate cyclohydrolase FolD n=1 Tax=Anaeromusa acidaminophila TaxID=81464 RepID=UPI000362CDC4|nr:bifunctional methylenetetrahydrofolate dehydrogenase/methenyltetrahydrofolate cyclohydrolase FolD [Anaeromusa acidaminophila]
MTARVLSGKEFALQIKEEVRRDAAALLEKTGVIPGLTVVLVGEDAASQVYVNNKHKACLELGIRSDIVRLPGTASKEELLAVIELLNQDKTVHGILVQLPLPKALRAVEQEVLLAIDPAKDVDGFHPLNAGRLAVGDEHLVPCTPAGCVKMLEMAGVEIQGKHAVVIGRSNIVGKPMAQLLLARNATVTICHSRTKDLAAMARQADILVAAVGKTHFVTADMVKSGAVVIDVGINRLPNGKLAGDVDFEKVQQVAGAITPVPGGVGLLTIAMLLANTVKAAQLAAQ